MTFRYNPQSFEKQVRKWPVLFSETNLRKDIVERLEQLLGISSKGWCDPFSVELPFDQDIIYEYGIDACRLATINSNFKKDSESFLEPAFKWIAKFYDTYSKKGNASFTPIPWLEALIQMQDHIITRKSERLALALVMKAFKISPPNIDISEREKALVLACITPFMPILSAYFSNNIEKKSINEIITSFKEYTCVKIALEKGGWHWHVFQRAIFENNPLSELSKIKWIKKATINKKTILKNEDGGIKICFS